MVLLRVHFLCLVLLVFQHVEIGTAETFETAQTCPNGCSGRGVCQRGVCTCDVGFTGTDCSKQTPADPKCKKTCPANSRCIDLKNAATINYGCMCWAGWFGNGPENSIASCSDINECPAGGCKAEANTFICVNLPGSFNCSCKPGFRGDGFTKCVDIDECAEGTPCGTGATCTNRMPKIGEGFQCYCNGITLVDPGVACAEKPKPPTVVPRPPTGPAKGHTARFKILPRILCSTFTSTSWNIYFEYKNTNLVLTNIGFNKENRITKNTVLSPGLEPGQPTSFAVGRNLAFKLENKDFGGSVSWRLDGSIVQIDGSKIDPTLETSKYKCPSSVTATVKLTIPCPTDTAALQTTLNSNFAKIVSDMYTTLGISPKGDHVTSAELSVSADCVEGAEPITGLVEVTIKNPTDTTGLQVQAMDLMFPIIADGSISRLSETTGTTITRQNGVLAQMSSAGMSPIEGIPDTSEADKDVDPNKIDIGFVKLSQLPFFILVGGVVFSVILLCVMFGTCFFVSRKNKQQQLHERV